MRSYVRDFREVVDKYCAHGLPQRVVDYLAPYLQTGVNYFVLAPVIPEDERRAHLERIAGEVLPPLRAMQPGTVP